MNFKSKLNLRTNLVTCQAKLQTCENALLISTAAHKENLEYIVNLGPIQSNDSLKEGMETLLRAAATNYAEASSLIARWRATSSSI